MKFYTTQATVEHAPHMRHTRTVKASSARDAIAQMRDYLHKEGWWPKVIEAEGRSDPHDFDREEYN